MGHHWTDQYTPRELEWKNKWSGVNHQLQTYYDEKARGVVHTLGWSEKMNQLQQELDEWRYLGEDKAESFTIDQSEPEKPTDVHSPDVSLQEMYDQLQAKYDELLELSNRMVTYLESRFPNSDQWEHSDPFTAFCDELEGLSRIYAKVKALSEAKADNVNVVRLTSRGQFPGVEVTSTYVDQNYLRRVLR